MKYAAHTTRPLAMGTNGMIASGHPLASQAGIRVLQEGGNAIDAAVTAAGVLAVTKPDACGVGGDLFVMYYDAAQNKVEAMNASGRAPAAMTVEALAASRRGPTNEERYTSFAPASGPHSASVPGAVQGWADILARHGSRTLAEALTPAIRYAADGFPVSVRLSHSMARGADLLRRCKAAAGAYLKEGQPYRPGELIKLPDLARSITMIAEGGPDAFSRGELARTITEAHQEEGGYFTQADFARQDSVVDEPLSIHYRGYQVFNQRPVSLGAVFLEELKIMEGFDPAGLPWDSAERVHRQVEAKKLAFADLDRYLTDPDFVEAPLVGLMSDEYAARQRARIDPQRASSGFEAGDPARFGNHTTYMAVVDSAGNAVSWIQTLFHRFGSGWMAPGTGILLNDRMNGFSTEPNHVNRVEGGKRTAHTLNAPMVFQDGGPRLVFGTPGGYGQVQSNLQLLMNFVDYGMDAQSMIEAPRWLSQAGTSLAIEARFSQDTLAGLRKRGHQVDVREAWTDAMGGAQAIHINPLSGVLEGAADPRREGYAIGW